MKEPLRLRYAFRDALTQALEQDLVGPSADDEVIQDAPLTRYLSGILHPRGASAADHHEDLWGIGDANVDEHAEDEPVSMANANLPSSMGLTFAVKGSGPLRIVVEVEAGRYERTPKDSWRRVPVRVEPLVMDLTTPVHGAQTPVAEGLELFRRVRRADPDGQVSVTLALVNTNTVGAARQGEADSLCFLQPSVRVRLESPTTAHFVDRTRVTPGLDDADIAAGRLLFRHVHNLAVGHGCAVTWEQGVEPDLIETTFTPTFDLLLAESNPAISGWYLDMRAPSIRSRTEMIAGFEELIAGYRSWIARQREALPGVPTDLRTQAEAHLEDAARAADRMESGLRVLSDQTDSLPYLAFMLMSEAMVEQRVRSERVLADRSDLAPDHIPAVWRPFQLAFILLCLEGVANADADTRELADLLWFPTGGGKTEAYLGLIAFTLLLRRLRRRPHGVSALMRYTLRLLTTQQFERAALLMCCLEKVRGTRSDLGTQEFEVGLYVGRSGTPNNAEAAKKALEKLRGNPRADVTQLGNPIQIRICVWCGAALTAHDYDISKKADRCRPRCPNPSCDFKGGLPWLVVDSDLFEARPSLVIGTVDKFAGLAWYDAAGALFNRRPGQDPGLDLIIQDELHLISGPLGTITGLYEAAIDELARNADGRRPKVIASTATIRRAGNQMRSVFDRRVAQFPPPAIDARDSYFAVDSRADSRGTRRYVGLMAPGQSLATLMVRTYARLFFEATCGDWPEDVRDTYWTLVGYFNSLRVLAGAQLQVVDDVEDRISVISAGSCNRSPGDRLIELNSRATSSDIPDYLRSLRVPFPSESAIDVVLATNMISVGVDVDRLGLMVVAGQPQATAEYIQATSRVGRRDPGLVITLYNGARSRDRSHYESFLPYHAALYREVEATSATPFSPRARDRALHATLVVLARHLVPALRPETGAAAIGDHLREVAELVDRLVERARRIDAVSADAVRRELEAFVMFWTRRAEDDPALVYTTKRNAKPGLLVGASDVLGSADHRDEIPTMWSMRDVDRTSALYLMGL